MMKKDESGKVVEFEDEAATKVADFPRAERKSSAPANRDDIELEYEIAVKATAEESMRSLGAALKVLQDDVIKADADAKLAKQAAKDKFANAKRAAERQLKLLIEAAEVVREAEFIAARQVFYKTMNPINAKVEEIKVAHQVKLNEDLEKLAVFRQQQLAMLPKPPKPVAAEAVTDSATDAAPSTDEALL